ncbi:hypothetical protein K9M47_04550 [Candidatus Gracilibacteria bacterium]|nr:hypothetical protein [Candidatus Gracilibacteria bacterium]MCF7898954.1 hypothetical protein [Candidatus Paceibacterota bacterium]
MKKQIILQLSIVILLSPFITYASTDNVEKDSKQIKYSTCKKDAQVKRKKTMLPALREYLIGSELVTENTKKEFDKIRWYMNSTYGKAEKKIFEKREKEMVLVNDKINKSRRMAQATWRAEDSLCDFFYNRASTTPE